MYGIHSSATLPPLLKALYSHSLVNRFSERHAFCRFILPFACKFMLHSLLRISIYPIPYVFGYSINFWGVINSSVSNMFHSKHRILRSCLDFHSFILLIFYALPFYLLAYIFLQLKCVIGPYIQLCIV